jgi:hypothetical protein
LALTTIGISVLVTVCTNTVFGALLGMTSFFSGGTLNVLNINIPMRSKMILTPTMIIFRMGMCGCCKKEALALDKRLFGDN